MAFNSHWPPLTRLHPGFSRFGLAVHLIASPHFHSFASRLIEKRMRFAASSRVSVSFRREFTNE